MPHRASLDHLIDLAITEQGHEALRPVIGKEILHYDILNLLNEAGYFRRLVFHGGTALRLVHGGSRYSEDLDFAGGEDFRTSDVKGIVDVLGPKLEELYGVPVTIKPPQEHARQVNTWAITVITHPENRSLPAQKINIDIERAKTWTREPRSLRRNYDFLPGALDGLLVPTMSLAEIMTNKLVALPASFQHDNIRHRDIWDLAWLHQRNVEPLPEAFANRIAQNGIASYASLVDNCIAALPDKISSGEFSRTMRRFLPQNRIASLNHTDAIENLVMTMTELLRQAKQVAA